MSDLIFSNIKGLLIQENKSYADWMALKSSKFDFEKFYGCNIVNTEFNNWIKENC